MTRTALTIAGSDSGGGAGIQADLKTFSALGVYGMSVITALTAQNTKSVTGIFPVEPTFVAEQIDAVFDDIPVHAVKLGMLGGPEVIRTVAERLRHWRPRWIVLDPVMVAKSGDKLLPDAAVEALKTELLPLASIITPNLPEAAVLLGEPPARERRRMPAVAARLQGLGVRDVLLKGGHLDDDGADGNESADVLLHGGELLWQRGPRIATRNTHGTGCTLSAAIAAGLASGLALPDAVGRAKSYITGAIEAADRLAIGHGHGPVHHFFRIWPNGGNGT
jgi:hydroxymethylpyrimidine/phosphomethylpyrimidine kinase